VLPWLRRAAGRLGARARARGADARRCAVAAAAASVLSGGRDDNAGAARLFLRVKAPRGELDRSAIAWVVRAACDRAGLPRVGPHRLRHTAATEMLRRGASLREIGQVLRHREQKTTAIYAKVDRAALRALARPWRSQEGGVA
jgi:integrase/recombinase XerD